MAHTCHATDCTTAVPPEMWGCRHHWYMVPKLIRQRILAAYRPGQCDDYKPSREYLEAARAAVVAVAAREGRTPDTRLYDMFLTRYERAAVEQIPPSTTAACGCPRVYIDRERGYETQHVWGCLEQVR